MLPPGHIAAGFLTAKALIHFTQPSFDPSQVNQMLWWGAFFGFAPDLDMFVSFFREKSFTVKSSNNNHRKFISHAPILWLLAGLAIYTLASSPYWKSFGVLFWLGSWSHFLLDTVEYGIMWLWPFSSRMYALKDREKDKADSSQNGFFGFWWGFVKRYARMWSFYLEIVIILIVLIQIIF